MSIRLATSRVALLAGLLFAVPGGARGETISFEADPLGNVPDGFQSADSPLVRFRGTVPGQLTIVRNFSGELLGTRGLVNFGPIGSELILDFSVPVTELSLFFGNDDPDHSVPGQTAVLRAFANGTLIGESSVLMNRNDLMDQSISFAMPGVVFTRATFDFSPGLRKLARPVDDISFTPVPEPSSLVLVGAGLLLAGRRRKA